MWQDEALCDGMDSEIFFPPQGGGRATAAILQAKRICAECPVQSECLRVAQEFERDFPRDRSFYHGVYGGMSGPERMMLKGA